MIKYLKHIFVAAIAMMAATGCQEDVEDTFSKAPVAPTLVNNNAILLTQNTMDEPVKWAWTAARNTQGEVSYSLFAQYEEETPVQLGSSTKELSLSLPKTDLKAALDNIASLPENDSFTMAFYVEATDDLGSYKSEEVVVTVFSYGDYVAAVVTPSVAEVTLDKETPDDELELLTWTSARLGYGEAITYNVTATYGDSEPVEVATGLTDLRCAKTVSEWNEFFVRTMGIAEEATKDVNFTVTAYSETCTSGVPSAAVTVKVTTYKRDFPSEEYIYVPGNHQGWNPATAPALWSAELNGVYSGFSTLDGGFKFTLQRAWGEGGEGEYNYSHFTNYSEGLTDGGGGNINMSTPGFYYIVADVMTGTLKATLISSWGVIGTATPNGWDAETPLTYDAEKGCWSATIALTAGDLKFRANNSWESGIDLGGALDELVFKGGNIAITEAGNYLMEVYMQRTDSNNMYCKLTPQ